ncbi:MAG: DNA polymerase III subunit gamma/tau, partial [Paracoccaceae bacterium]|nr:DNA polymerase III subunit gamma/tau [Paracoccaceae bacterium]
RAAAARYKIYIIDEVHMLSTNAFNALLKTLEEPPQHVKFIFATTEIRKVPVTVLSRCQRFDLRRIEPEVMIALLQKIASEEHANIAEEALALITRAAEGSARDATSLLDQAISHGAGETTADQVRAMLGLADRGRVMDLFDMIMRGDASSALGELGAQYSDGADPLAVLRDLTEITHWVSVVKITPNAADDPTISPDDRIRGQGFAQALPMRALTRAWQMLLKALEEVASAPNSMMAADMAIIRLTHVADLPTPEELVKKLQDLPPPSKPSGSRSAGQMVNQNQVTPSMQGTRTAPLSSPNASGASTALALADEQALLLFPTFEHVVNIIRDHRDIRLLVDVETCIQLSEYRPGRIEFEPTETAPGDLAQRLGSRLQAWTGVRWAISLVSTGGKPTIDAERQAKDAALKEVAATNPLVRAVFSAFPKATISDVKTLEAMAAQAQLDALPEVDDEWDPFEED